MIRTRIKDALRASIDTEDQAIAKRTPTRERKRVASVKAAVRQATRQAEALVSPSAAAAKPLQVTLSTDEAEALKRTRDAVRAAGPRVGKSELLRAAVRLLEQVPTETLVECIEQLPTLKQTKG